METRPIRFRRLDEKIDLPDIPWHFFEEANKLYVRLNDQSNLIAKLADVYAYMDTLVPFIASFASCSKGCSHCCHHDVQITTFEAEYIYLKTGVPHTIEREISTGNRTPCPFLRYGGECGIYPARPIICRTYHVLGDPVLCADPNGVQIQYGTCGSNFGNKIYENLINWVHYQTAFFDGDCKDIRDFFPHSRTDVQSYLSRESE